MATTPLFRIGARGSPLSRAQVAHVTAMMARVFDIPAERIAFVHIATSGDQIQDRALIEAGGKGLFTKELDEALFDGRIDLALHSMKDVPIALPEGLAIAAVPERDDPRDAFISLRATALADLPRGAKLGTASVRRQAQALHQRPDLACALLRGNVQTRLSKIETGEFDATFLALAGLKRLGLAAHAAGLVDPVACPPAACQGALAIVTKTADAAQYAPLVDARATIETAAERAFLDVLDGSCRTPIAALARYENDGLTFIGETLAADGARRWRAEAHERGPLSPEDAVRIGRACAEQVRADQARDS
ncbi:MAG: hydroxymethylbilane synthase [Alphaproteobacteria bacterium]|nr:hydroxymethylbilane synthase [Alphaproteobacteria bacterium]